MRKNRRPISTTGAWDGSAAVGTGTWATYHSANITGLEPETTYHYRVKSVDMNGNEAVSSDQTLTTPSGDALIVDFLDVPNGDAILMMHGTSTALIDFGDGTSDIVPYVRDHVHESFDAAVATHGHGDHVGGGSDVLDAIGAKQVWHNGDAQSTETYNNFMNAVQAADADVHVPYQGDEIRVGSLCFSVLNSAGVPGTTNNKSIVLALQHGQVNFLFAGDAEHEAEARMLGAGLVPPTVVLKVPHHGSKTASSRVFLEEARPQIAICTAGMGNAYGHPHAETISALHSVGARTYVTGIDGTINVTTDGKTYTVATSRQATALIRPESRDTTAPVISQIWVSHITSSAATVTWIASESATSQVEYGLTTSYGSSTEANSSLLTSCGVILSSRAPIRTYHF
jgi:competence protein ComEC